MSILQSFLDRVEAFLRRTRMAPTRFGIELCGDPSFVAELRRGRRPNVDLIDRADEFMRSYRRGGAKKKKRKKAAREAADAAMDVSVA